MQIHDLLDGYYLMVKSLASKVREFDAAETASDDFSWNLYPPIVLIDVRKPLKNHVPMVKYCKCHIFLD